MPFLERLVRGEAPEAAKDSAINLAVTRGRWDPCRHAWTDQLVATGGDR